LEFVGTRGTASVDAFRQKVDVYRGAHQPAEWAFWGDNPDGGLIADFVAAVRERRDPCATGVDGLRALEVSLAAEQSARSGKAVAIRPARVA
jgi:predicted dehydrogenase